MESWEEVNWGIEFQQTLIKVDEEDVTSSERAHSETSTDDEGPRLPTPEAVFKGTDIRLR